MARGRSPERTNSDEEPRGPFSTAGLFGFVNSAAGSDACWSDNGGRLDTTEGVCKKRPHPSCFASRKQARSVSLSERFVGQTHEAPHRERTDIPLILATTGPLIRIVSFAFGVCKTTTFTNKPHQIFCKTALPTGIVALYRMSRHTLSGAPCVILLFLGNTVYLFSARRVSSNGALRIREKRKRGGRHRLDLAIMRDRIGGRLFPSAARPAGHAKRNLFQACPNVEHDEYLFSGQNGCSVHPETTTGARRSVDRPHRWVSI